MLKSKFIDDSNKITKDTVVHGSIQTKNNIIIHGEVLGYVASDNQIKISKKGSVQNSISGNNCLILGSVKGDVEAKAEIVIGPSAKIGGNLLCKKIRIEQGAKLSLFQKMFENPELSDEQLLADKEDSKTDKI